MKYDLASSSLLLSAYLHQDWVDEFENVSDAIGDIVKSEPTPILHRAAEELRDLLAAPLSDANLQEIMTDDIGCYFAPSSIGQSYHRWLADVASRFESAT